MKFLLCFVAVVLMTSSAFTSEQRTQLRPAFACPDRGTDSICSFGTIPSGTTVTVLAKNWKASAVAKETFPNKDFENEFETITRLQATTEPPAEATMIAAFAPAGSIELIPEHEVRDDTIDQKVTQYLRRMKHMDKDAYKYEIKTRIYKLSSTLMLAEAKLSSHIETKDPRTGEKLISCEGCDDDTVPLLIGPNLIDLFADLHASDTQLCGGVVAAFKLNGRVHVLSRAYACESDAYSYTMVHDLSGKAPRLVFKY